MWERGGGEGYVCSRLVAGVVALVGDVLPAGGQLALQQIHHLSHEARSSWWAGGRCVCMMLAAHVLRVALAWRHHWHRAHIGEGRWGRCTDETHDTQTQECVSGEEGGAFC